jgi:hypothetical protein
LRFGHNDPTDLDRKLAALDPAVPKLVAFESVYSMDGDIAPIRELCDVAEAHGELTYLNAIEMIDGIGKTAGGKLAGRCANVFRSVSESAMRQDRSWSHFHLVSDATDL